MKKIFYLAAILLAFNSCTSGYKTTATYTSLEHVDLINVEGYTGISIFEIEYNGHEYLIFDGYNTMGVEHNPDCKKCKSRSEYTPTEYLY